MDVEQLKKDYDKYWDCEEINIDLANRLVYRIPKLLGEMERLALEAKAQSNARAFNWLEVKRLRKALDQIETHIRSTSDPIPHIVKTLKEVEVEPK